MRWSQKCTCFSWTLPLTSPFFTSRTSHGQTDCWDTGDCVRVAAWQKWRPSLVPSPRSLPQPLRPRGALYTPPRAVSLSDTILFRQALRLHRCATDILLLFLYLETNKVLFWSLRVVLYFLVICYGARRGFVVLLRGEEQKTPNMGISCY